jgi:hypothetical protein
MLFDARRVRAYDIALEGSRKAFGHLAAAGVAGAQKQYIEH